MHTHTHNGRFALVLEWRRDDFLDGDDHNDYMMMSITLKVRVRPEDSGKQMICQVKKTNHENLHIFFFVPIIFWFV